MSTLKVSAINNAAASSGGLSIDSSGVVTGGLPSPNRNLLYNGAMQVAQRGTSTSGISSASTYRTADRVFLSISSLGTWTESVENDAPTGSGLRKSWKLLCTTADASPTAAGFLGMSQRLEGQDLQRIAKGTSDAQQLTLSFWVKSNVTGTYVVHLADIDNTRQVGAQYTISASATWEKKTITFPADTTGAFDNDNAHSLSVLWWLAAGSDRTSGTLRTAWTSTTTADVAAGQTNLASATNNYWQVTGVQLEVGPTATPFEFKSYGTELAECQRYYCEVGDMNLAYANMYAAGTADAIGYASFPAEMRAAPTVTLYIGNASGQVDRYGVGTVSGVAAGRIDPCGFGFVSKTGAFTKGDGIGFSFKATAEL
jgi:hypothetical protein